LLPGQPADESRLLDLLLGLELQRSRIDAVTQSGRFRAIRKDVPQVGIAARAQSFGPAHAVAGIQRLFDAVIGQRLVEAWPATAGLVLGVRTEQRRSAGHAAVNALGMIVVVLAGKRRLGAFLSHDA